ncbi:hypothetical protein [Chitinophaga arvensicola]|uniref:Uncharacterized protein n=1 Tax=Chitinophaga arvensicola TaxID=29529 RepID=A0A1I0S5W5_9BACT|nr:hypothetical protein [Chitinophaga arvensicola]SEW50651.1 hypothetical protein SAMN04488122_3908 [Chitinophaga arvensicola]
MHNNNYTFNDQFFAHIRAPKYQLQKVTAVLKGLSIFPTLENIYLSFVDRQYLYYTAAAKGLTVHSTEIVSNSAEDSFVRGAVMILNIPAELPNVMRVRGLVVPYSLAEKLNPWDVMGMEGNIHQLETVNYYQDDYGQCVHSSADSHGGAGESHPSGIIRFGVMFQEEQLRSSIFEKDTYTYTVDYKHVYVSPVHPHNSVVEAMKTQCWPGNLDVSILHRDAGTYEVEKKGEHILFRVL